MSDRRGWTLMELLIYMVIGAVAVSMMYRAVHGAYDLLVVQRRALGEVHSSLRLEEAMTADIRRASAAEVAQDTLVLTVPEGTTVYSYGADGGLWRIESKGDVEESRQAFPFALDSCRMSRDDKLVTITYRRRNVVSRQPWASIPERSFTVSTWIEE